MDPIDTAAIEPPATQPIDITALLGGSAPAVALGDDAEDT